MKVSSTPTHVFVLPFVYDKYAEKFVVTYAQGGEDGAVVLRKTEEDIGSGVSVSGNCLTVELTQDETKKFEQGEAVAEVKVWTKNRKALISDKIYIPVEAVLDDEAFV